jgi:hypothetical protein
MARRRATQLALDWLTPLQWQEVPPAARERIGDLLAELLRHAASGDGAREAGDDQ